VCLQQRLKCAGSAGSSGGSSSQRAIRHPQRGAKLQPGGSAMTLGT
jgi:hypothetical protein